MNNSSCNNQNDIKNGFATQVITRLHIILCTFLIITIVSDIEFYTEVRNAHFTSFNTEKMVVFTKVEF